MQWCSMFSVSFGLTTLRYLFLLKFLDWDVVFIFQYTDEEVERCYEEFYEDVHTEFLKFGEIVNFKVANCSPCPDNDVYNLLLSSPTKWGILQLAFLFKNYVRGIFSGILFNNYCQKSKLNKKLIKLFPFFSYLKLTTFSQFSR